jgi:hypothetical protein
MDAKDSSNMVDTGLGDAGCQTQNQYALVPVSDVVDVATSNNDNDSGITTTKYKGLQNQGAT